MDMFPVTGLRGRDWKHAVIDKENNYSKILSSSPHLGRGRFVTDPLIMMKKVKMLP